MCTFPSFSLPSLLFPLPPSSPLLPSLPLPPATLADPTSEMHLQPDPLFNLPTDNVNMLTISGSPLGRIFLGGKDGCLYEVVYQVRTVVTIILLFAVLAVTSVEIACNLNESFPQSPPPLSLSSHLSLSASPPLPLFPVLSPSSRSSLLSPSPPPQWPPPPLSGGGWLV